MRIFFLDDNHNRYKVFASNCIGHTIDYAQTAEQALRMLATNEYDIIFLDHDLNEEHYTGDYSLAPTGFTVAKQMREFNHLHGAKVVVHSLNSDGRQNIKSAIKDCYSVWIPEDGLPTMLWTHPVDDLLERIKILEDRSV